MVAVLLLIAPALRDDSKDIWPLLALTLWDPDPQSWWVLIVSLCLLALLICEKSKSGIFPFQTGSVSTSAER